MGKPKSQRAYKRSPRLLSLKEGIEAHGLKSGVGAIIPIELSLHYTLMNGKLLYRPTGTGDIYIRKSDSTP